MDKNSAKIVDYVVTKTHIDIDPNLSGEFQIKAENRAQINPPADPADKKMLLLYSLKLYIPDTELLFININAEFRFEFDEIPEDYAKIGEELCIPQALGKLYELIDNILITMNRPPLELPVSIPQALNTKQKREG